MSPAGILLTERMERISASPRKSDLPFVVSYAQIEEIASL